MCTQYELCTNVKGLYTVKNQQHVKGSCPLACILEHVSMILSTYIPQGNIYVTPTLAGQAMAEPILVHD